MEDFVSIGKKVTVKRLQLNMTMEALAKKANITRSTLWSIEKGKSSYSAKALFAVLDVLDLKLSLDFEIDTNLVRSRASRINNELTKKINQFIILCIEEYAEYSNSNSAHIYSEMNEKGIIDDLEKDYEFFHGMSTPWINDYIDGCLNRK